jgi:hypothetical protein
VCETPKGTGQAEDYRLKLSPRKGSKVKRRMINSMNDKMKNNKKSIS